MIFEIKYFVGVDFMLKVVDAAKLSNHLNLPLLALMINSFKSIYVTSC